MTLETIPINRDRVLQEEPFTVHVSDLTAWPSHELFIHFEYNSHAGKWIFEIEEGKIGTIIHRSMAHLGVRYKYNPYAMFMFKDSTGDETELSTDNLGDTVELCVYPGPLGGSFLPEAGISKEEEDRLLRRDWWAPVG